MRIEQITTENIAYLVQLGKEFVEAGVFGITGPEFDWDFAMANTREALSRDTYYIRMAYNDLEIPCGFVAGHMTQFHFSPKWFGVEDSWYVREGTPGRAKIGMALMKGLIHWALDAKGGEYLESGDIASIDSVAVWELYKHMGFKRYGSVYKYSRGLG